MSIRLRRLMGDYEKIKTEFSGHKYISIKEVTGNPPEKYQIEYNVKGLRWDAVQKLPVVVEKHLVEIYLSAEYPRSKPTCSALTPVFHPNFSGNRVPDIICIGDHWAPSSSLVEIIAKIGEMIQLRDYNINSPLYPYAAHWIKNNQQYLPIGNVDMYQADADVDFVSQNKDDDLDIVFETVGSSENKRNKLDIVSL